MKSLLLVCCSWFAFSPAPLSLGQSAPPERYLRNAADPEGGWESLEIAIRELAPRAGSERADGPHLFLVGAAHIATPAFYDELQAFFDSCDVVLFEGVKPPASGPQASAPEVAPAVSDPRDAAWRARVTARRLRAMHRRLESWREREGSWPVELAQVVKPGGLLGSAQQATRDGWGHSLRYAAPLVGERELQLTSLGADGEPGGEGPDQDLALADAPRLVLRDSGHTAGLQAKLAGALGLVFQLDAMDSDEPGWRNSDMDIETLKRRLAEEEVDASLLLGALDGSSAFARLQGKLLELIGSTKLGSGALRLIGLELLGRADELFESLPGELGKLMDVLLVERNQVILNDLRTLLAPQAGSAAPQRIAIFYGAGHLRDIETRLVNEFGYEALGSAWVEAFRVEFDQLGLSSGQVGFLRRTVRMQLDMQLALGRAMSRKQATKPDSEGSQPDEQATGDGEE